ncbi:MAG: hypothetical protein COA78_31150 [Blastopirellula sp.]|nr:MAG: hypothetical protein COA78_31150 [Blastopirellula sp.]
MAELIQAKNLSWRHLHLLEDPFFAKAAVESAVKAHKSRSMASARGISNFPSWLDRTRMPLSNLNHTVLNSLKNGTSYYVHRNTEKPARPLVFWQPAESGEHSYLGTKGAWEIHDHVTAPLCNKLNILLKQIEPPKPVVIQKIVEIEVEQAIPVSYISQNERHMFVLEVESENDAPIPEEVYVNLVGFNKTQNTLPVDQNNDVTHDFDSQIFRAKRGDSFEVFAIPDRMKTVKKDFQDNKNLKQSVLNKSISALKIIDTYTRADNVIVHAVEYIIPEYHMLVIEQEFGAHLSGPHHEMFVLQDEDSDWVQRIEVTKSLSSPQTELKGDGWVRLQFEDIPKKGTFSLYSVAMDKQSSPVVHFNAQTTDDLKKVKVVDDLQTAASDIEELEDDDNAIAMNEFDSWLDDWATAI